MNYKYLNGYNQDLLAQVDTIIKQNRLGDVLLSKYKEKHNVSSDKELYKLGANLKNQFMKNAKMPDKIYFDNKIELNNQALGLHSYIPIVHGRKIKMINDIKISSRFKSMPYEFLYNVLIHELAHLKEKDHNKAFFMLCEKMSPSYFQVDFDLRLYLTYLELYKTPLW